MRALKPAKVQQQRPNFKEKQLPTNKTSNKYSVSAGLLLHYSFASTTLLVDRWLSMNFVCAPRAKITSCLFLSRISISVNDKVLPVFNTLTSAISSVPAGAACMVVRICWDALYVPAMNSIFRFVDTLIREFSSYT